MELIFTILVIFCYFGIVYGQTNPVAQHVPAAVTANQDNIITLLPYDADSDPMTVDITALPATGTLYQTSANYDSFAILPARGTAISAVPTTVTSPDYKVVYAAPANLASTKFEYDVTDDEPLSSGIGQVFVTLSDLVTETSNFDTDADSWQVVAASSNAAAWSATSTGSLNHYIYGGNIPLVVQANNEVRWYFNAPAKFLGDQCLVYGGTVRFWFGSFAGEFVTNLYSNPKNFIVIECSTCDSGNGITIAQRSVTFTGGQQYYEFTLDENPGNGWGKDPFDDRVTSWSSPTQCEVVEVLSAISAIKVYADLTSSYESIGIDGFELLVGSGVPLACM